MLVCAIMQNVISRRKNMRFCMVGIFCMFCFGAFAEPSVPTKSYVNNANNLTTGTVNIERLPVGEGADKVAAGNDKRFDSVPLSKPSEATVGEGRALIWIE